MLFYFWQFEFTSGVNHYFPGPSRLALQDTLCFAFLPFGKKIMEDILKELHLESLISHFLAERIEPATKNFVV